MIDFDNLSNKPDFITNTSINYLSLVGSRAYGGATEESDYDFYGWVIPPAEYIFPHIAGYIDGFSNNKLAFDQFELRGINTQYGRTDVTIYNIVKYFKLVADGNPNMLHSLFAPSSCIYKSDVIGNLVLTYKKICLSQRVYHTFRGIAFSHFKKLKSKHCEPDSKRARIIEKYGYDTKDASYCLRFMWELEELLLAGDLHVDRFGEEMIAIRNGKYSFDKICYLFKLVSDRTEKVKKTYTNLPLRKEPDMNRIQDLLIDCLAFKHGCLSRFGYNILS